MHSPLGHAHGLLEAMPQGLLSLDLSGRLTMANPRACVLLGLSWPPPAGHPRDGLLLLEGFPGLSGIARHLFAVPESAGGEPALLHDPDTGRRLLVSSSLLRDGTGAPREVILSLADMGAQLGTEAHPRQDAGLAALDLLAAGLAHDIRNPLTSIKTYASVLRAKKDQPGFMERFERSMGAGITRIEGLLDELASLSRPVALSMAAVDLHGLLSHCLGIMEEELTLRDLAWELTAEDGLPLARGDEEQLRQAFLAVLRSSCQAMTSGGRLMLNLGTARLDGPEGHGRLFVVARVADTGPEVPAETLARFFEPYASPRSKGGSSGLSLTLARKIVIGHGGSIEAHGRSGGGVTFTARLPAML